MAIGEAKTTLVSEAREDEEHADQDNFWNAIMTRLRWYPKDMPTTEKNLVLKLDLCILIFGCLSFFTKYLDQQSITNAYVSGMREDLKLFGNEINYLTATFWASYCVFTIPACYFLTKYPANWILPALEVGWGLSTFGLAWARNVETLYAMRFLTGLFECCSFTGTIYVIGCWYKPSEMGRRIALFYIAAPLGTMFAGYLQAAAYTNLRGVHGLEGRRCLFIVDAIITLPISLIGFFVFPDVPWRRRPRLVTQSELDLARRRLEGMVAPPELKVSRSIFKRVFSRWHVYVFVLQWTLMNQAAQAASQPFSLYLKAKSNIYSVVRINTLPTAATAISIVAAVSAGVVADKTGKYWIPSIAVTVPVLVGVAMLVAWDYRTAITDENIAISPLTMGWASITMANDAEERAVVTASMNAIGEAIVAGTQVVQFPATKAPNLQGGFISLFVTTSCQLVFISLVLYLTRRGKKASSLGESFPVEKLEIENSGKVKELQPRCGLVYISVWESIRILIKHK